MVQVEGFDHVVLNVADAEVSLRWYTDKLGLKGVRVEQWRAGEVPFVSVRIDEGTIIDLLVRERTGVNADHVCLVVGNDVDLEVVAASGEFDVISGPRRLFGARGVGVGMYVRDPDGNVIELRNYP